MSSLFCPRCGSALAPERVQGLCPNCLLASAESGDSIPPAIESADRERKKPTAPTVEELAAHFPGLRLESLIAVGGMGAVYQAQQLGLGRTVALKILHAEVAAEPGFSERFQREARTLATLSHPGLVSVHDFGQAGPHFYFVMEFVDGVNLRQMIRAKSIEPAAALKLVMQICEVLQYAHDHGVVHRDIKPENILVNRAGQVKVLDFGLSKVVGKDPESPLLTRTSQVMGTPHYMAPEQWERPLEVDHRADIYALGVVFYELLTGELPIGRFAAPSKRVTIDVRLDEVVLRTLDKAPELRYQQASELHKDVGHISSTRAGTPRAGAIPPPIPKHENLTPQTFARAQPSAQGARSVGLHRSAERLPGPLIALIVFYVVATVLVVIAATRFF